MYRFPSRFAALLAVLALAVVAFGQDGPPKGTDPPAPPTASGAMDAATKVSVLSALQDVITKNAFVPGVDFSKWPQFVAERKSDLDKADTDIVFARVLNGILHDFGVSHIRLRTPIAARMRQTGTTTGLGMRVKKVEAGLEVTSVVPQGPAGQVGIEVGDVIKNIAGKPVDDPKDIQVDPGKTIEVTLVKKNGGTKDVTMENKPFSVRRPETLTWIAPDAAVIRIYTFAQGYDRENVESLIKEADERAKYLVVDLRSNGGGAVSNLNHFLSMLMPDATPVGTFISRTAADEYAKTHTDGDNDPIRIAAWNSHKFKTNKREGVKPFEGRIAVLINRGSASASEIACAALKECRGAVVVGTDSLGAVLASTYGRLPGGFELQYPVQDYVTIRGERLEGHPRIPDLVVQPSPSAQDDAPQKAYDLLKSREAEHLNTAAPDNGHSHRAAA